MGRAMGDSEVEMMLLRSLRTDDELKECMGKCLKSKKMRCFPKTSCFLKNIVFFVGMTFSSVFEAPGRTKA